MAGEVNVPYEGCKAAWDAYEERESLPWMVRVDATVEAAAPYIDRAARAQERRIAADKLFGLARLMAAGELEVADLERAAEEMADEANKLEADRG